MKQVIYQGEGATIGRFGAVKKGQKLELYEYEFQGIKDDPAFKDVSVKLSAEELEIAQRIKPLGCKTFDLRTIPWEKRTIAKLITARFSKTSLIRVINAINEVGGVIDVNTAHVSRNGLVDIILCAASTMGWNKLSKHERLSLGTLGGESAAPPVEEEPLEDADGNPILASDTEPESESETPEPTHKALRKRTKK